MIVTGRPVEDAPQRGRKQTAVIQHGFYRFQLLQRQIAAFGHAGHNASQLTVAKRHADATAGCRLRSVSREQIIKQAR